MKYPNGFCACHPIVNFTYFFLVLAITMLLMHPVSLLISLVCAVCCSISLRGGKAVRFSLLAALPTLLLTMIVNPLFSHEGATILTYLPSGNPLTLESMVYGAASGLMLAASLVWFSCCTAVLTSDKFVYLFGRIIPALSLILSMSLRFIPRFAARCKETAQAQRCLKPMGRLRSAVKTFSIVVTWSLESAVDTADSMKSRGYGLKGRTAYAIYRFDRRDKLLLAFLLLCGGYILCGVLAGGLTYQYFPLLRFPWQGPFPISFHLAHFALCLTPVIVNRKEALTWSCSRSAV